MESERVPAVRRPWGPIVLLTVFITVVVTASPVLAIGQTGGVDPFYERLFQDGTLALSTGDATGAARQLRLACFGMLDAPERLADCLARLALAHALAEDRDGFLEALSRVIEVERRFRSYSKATIPPELRRDFERQVEAWAPTSLLSGLPAFEEVADRQRAVAVQRLPAEERRRELDRLIAQSPQKTIWRRLQIELELESGNYRLAAELIEPLASGREDLRCPRGRAQAGLGSCEARTLADLDACVGESRQPALEALLACHIGLGDKDAGETVAAQLDESQRQKRSVRDLLRALSRMPERSAEPEVEPASETVSEAEVAGNAGPSASEIATLDAGWSTLRSDARELFEQTYEEVSGFASRYANWSEAQHLAAELAYRLSRWERAVHFFERAEAVSTLRSDQEFYLAVALFKSGRQQAAEERLEACLPHIQSSDYVRFWTERIRSGS